MHHKRPSGHELIKRINEAKEFLETRLGIFANVSKASGEFIATSRPFKGTKWRRINEVSKFLMKKKHFRRQNLCSLSATNILKN